MRVPVSQVRKTMPCSVPERASRDGRQHRRGDIGHADWQRRPQPVSGASHGGLRLLVRLQQFPAGGHPHHAHVLRCLLRHGHVLCGSGAPQGYPGAACRAGVLESACRASQLPSLIPGPPAAAALTLLQEADQHVPHECGAHAHGTVMTAPPPQDSAGKGIRGIHQHADPQSCLCNAELCMSRSHQLLSV